jgi:hypothetical protein
MYNAMNPDSIAAVMPVQDSAKVVRGSIQQKVGKADTSTDTLKTTKTRRDWSTWRPSPKRAMWLAIVVPGAGQIYNRKYWKLPIFYGGFLGCYYAMRWNNMMYRDYSQGYIDLNDGNLETQSYNQFMHLGMTIDESKPADVQRFSTKFKKRKDYYRRYRDMRAFILIGVYALSVIDAYVDASLSEFDISEDLSMKVSPTLMQNGGYTFNPVRTTSLGVHCSLTF